MKICCILLATANRINWLDMSIESINKLKFKFDEKILSVDEFDGNKLDVNLIEKYKSYGWKIDLVSFKNKHLSLKKAVNESKSDYIFYTEDDILIRDIPEKTKKILSIKDNNRECGILSMNLGGSLLDYPRNLGDLPFWLDNILYEDENLVSFLRLESQASRWFFEFPAMFVKTNIFNDILDGNIINNNVIEEELTKRYFNKNFHISHFKSAICKKNIKPTIDLLMDNKDVSFWIEILENSKFYKLLDPNQGGASINLNLIEDV